MRSTELDRTDFIIIILRQEESTGGKANEKYPMVCIL